MCTLSIPGFLFIIVLLLAFDLIVHGKSHTISLKESLLWASFWIGLAFAFNLWIWYCQGSQKALEFLAAYLVEESLSIDNLFVFILIFKYFHIPRQFEHKILVWGILGAIAFRALFIAGGLILIQRFEWILYFFGVFLIYTGYKLAMQKDAEIHPQNNPLIKFFKRFFPVTHDASSGKFIINGMLTPLFLALVAVETTDILFALDSIPAVLAITRDPFIVYTSNIFAILGLRTLYFALSGLMIAFHHLHYGLAFILTFIGLKMLAEHWIHTPIYVALGFIGSAIVLSIIASLIWPKPKSQIKLPEKGTEK